MKMEDLLENETEPITRETIENFVKKNYNEYKLDEIRVLLRSPAALKYFQFNTSAFGGVTLHIIQSCEDETQLLSFFQNEAVWHSSNFSNKSFQSEFFTKLLTSLISANQRFQNHDGIFHESSKFIQKHFFTKNMAALKSHLANSAKTNFPEEYALCKSIFKQFQIFYSNTDLTGFRLLFHSFINSSNNFDLVFKLFATLIKFLGFEISEIEIQLNFSKNPPTLDRSLRIINVLLQVLSTYKTETNSKLNSVTFSEFLRNLLQSIVTVKSGFDQTCCDIIASCIEIDPMIIEPIITEILLNTMLASKKQPEIDAYARIITKIMEVYKKLHRIGNFVSSVIITLKTNLIGEGSRVEAIYIFENGQKALLKQLKSDFFDSYRIDAIFPEIVMDYFTGCVTNMAIRPALNLFKTLLFHFNEIVEELDENEERIPCFIYIEALTTLLSVFLQSVRTAEHTITDTSIEKFIGGLENLTTMLAKFGSILLHREHNHILMRAFLATCYALGEISMIMAYYSAGDFKIGQTIDKNDNSACNLTYLHSYLGAKEWCLISERITNFGEENCKKMIVITDQLIFMNFLSCWNSFIFDLSKLLNFLFEVMFFGEENCKTMIDKLMIQKLRANLLFEDATSNEMHALVVKHLIARGNSAQHLSDRFFSDHLMEKYPSNAILDLCNALVEETLLKNGPKPENWDIFDSELITKGVLSVTCTKIAKLMKQKRKIDDDTVRKPLTIKLVQTEIFLVENPTLNFPELMRHTLKDNERQLDLKINESKFGSCIEILRKMPILHSSVSMKNSFVFIMLALHHDLYASNCDAKLLLIVENMILSLIKFGKMNLFEFVEPIDFFRLVFNEFELFEPVINVCLSVAIRFDAEIPRLRAFVDEIVPNLEHDKHLKAAIVVIDNLKKVRKGKLSPESKKLCSEYRLGICNGIVEVLLAKEPEEKYLIPYVLCLNLFLAMKEKEETCEKLISMLKQYTSLFSSVNVSQEAIEGGLALFKTIITNREVLSKQDGDFMGNVWKSMRSIRLSAETIEEYSAVVVLVVSHVSDEAFASMLDDLLEETNRATDANVREDFRLVLKIWSAILTSNFKTTKMGVILRHLEFIMEEQTLALRNPKYKEDFLEEIISFNIAIVKTKHLIISSPMIDLFLVSVTMLYANENVKNSPHFCQLSISLLMNLLRYRSALILSRFPPFLQQYRLLLKKLCYDSNSDFQRTNAEISQLADCAYQLENLTKKLVSYAIDMKRISLYLIADILKEYETVTLYPAVKIHLNNCVYNLMSLSDQHAVDFLMRVLSNASTEMFKVMYDNYKKYYRFTGKV